MSLLFNLFLLHFTLVVLSFKIEEDMKVASFTPFVASRPRNSPHSTATVTIQGRFCDQLVTTVTLGQKKVYKDYTITIGYYNGGYVNFTNGRHLEFYYPDNNNFLSAHIRYQV